MIPGWLTLEATLAYSLQFAAVGLLGLLLPRLLRIRDPEALETVWVATLALALAAPLLPFLPAGVVNAGAFRFSADAAAAAAPEAARLTLPLLLAVGVAVMLTWRMLGLVRLWLLRRAATPLEPTDVLGAETIELQRRLGAAAKYFRCDGIASPLVCGVMRPAVLLPRSFFAAPHEQRRAVLAHELIHVRRKDWAGLLGLEVSRSLLWFHPVVHLLLNRIANVREQVVDRRAIALTADRRSYLEALISIARAPTPHDRLLAPLFLERSRLKQRVQVILEEKPMPKLERYAWVAMVALALFTAADWARDSFPVYAQSSEKVYKVGTEGVTASETAEQGRARVHRGGSRREDRGDRNALDRGASRRPSVQHSRTTRAGRGTEREGRRGGGGLAIQARCEERQACDGVRDR